VFSFEGMTGRCHTLPNARAKCPRQMPALNARKGSFAIENPLLQKRSLRGTMQTAGRTPALLDPPAGSTQLDSRKYGKARIEILRWEGEPG